MKKCQKIWKSVKSTGIGKNVKKKCQKYWKSVKNIEKVSKIVKKCQKYWKNVKNCEKYRKISENIEKVKSWKKIKKKDRGKNVQAAKQFLIYTIVKVCHCYVGTLSQ